MGRAGRLAGLLSEWCRVRFPAAPMRPWHMANAAELREVQCAFRAAKKIVILSNSYESAEAYRFHFISRTSPAYRERITISIDEFGRLFLTMKELTEFLGRFIARREVMRVLNIYVEWDDEAKVWFVANSDVPGLSGEAATPEEMVALLQCRIPELMALNEPEAIRGSERAVPWKMVTERSYTAAIACG